MIVAMKKDALSLIELKVSMNAFDYSSEVQFSRLCQVVTELKNRGILADIYLLQINLDYGL